MGHEQITVVTEAKGVRCSVGSTYVTPPSIAKDDKPILS